jgi:hypothetical protein
LERAKIFISIRDFIYDFNKSQFSLSQFCCNVDTFFMIYVMIFRDAFKSENISTSQKESLYKSALITPKIPIKFFKNTLISKKYKLILLIVVKLLPYQLNVLLMKFYHFLKSLR